METPIYLHPSSVTILPKALWDMTCHVCDKRQSRWKYNGPEEGQLCSCCLLYESEWGRGVKGRLTAFIEDIETETGCELEKEESGRLVPSEADRVVGSLVLTNKIFAKAAQE